MVCTVVCITCTGCMKLTDAETEPLAVWCVQFLNIGSRSVHYDAVAT